MHRIVFPRYCLWLLECSHDTGKQYAVMFFGLAFQYKVVLNIFDRQVKVWARWGSGAGAGTGGGAPAGACTGGRRMNTELNRK